MVLEVILLHVAEVRWKLCMVKRVVHQIVAYVGKECTADDAVCECSCWENGVCEACEWEREDKEQERWHDQSKAIHRQIMMNAVEEEVKCQARPIVWEHVIDVEEESVEDVLEYCPDEDADGE